MSCVHLITVLRMNMDGEYLLVSIVQRVCEDERKCHGDRFVPLLDVIQHLQVVSAGLSKPTLYQYQRVGYAM